MRIIVALGNPGKEYKNTRHNLGFRLLDKFAAQRGCNPFEPFLGSLVSLSNYKEKNKFILCKPYEFMNDSGKTFWRICEHFRVNFKDILLIYDELDVSLGRFKLTQRQENHISHRGVRDVERHFPGKSILKLKAGIKPESCTNLIIRDFVMENFLPQELELIEKIEDDIFQIIEKFIGLEEEQLNNAINYLLKK